MAPAPVGDSIEIDVDVADLQTFCNRKSLHSKDLDLRLQEPGVIWPVYLRFGSLSELHSHVFVERMRPMFEYQWPCDKGEMYVPVQEASRFLEEDDFGSKYPGRFARFILLYSL